MRRQPPKATVQQRVASLLPAAGGLRLSDISMGTGLPSRVVRSALLNLERMHKAHSDNGRWTSTAPADKEVDSG